MDDAELVRQARTCIYGTKQTDALLVEMADRIEALVKERDEARAQLAASQTTNSVANAGSCQPVKVKPLVWRMAENRRGWEADGLGCQYYVPRGEPDRRKRCEVDHEARILSALEPAPHVSETPKGEHVRADVLTAMPAPVALAEAEGHWEDFLKSAVAEAEKAMRKFPQPNYVISKVAEEAGEVVKAAIHCAEARETAENVRAEMRQLIAMLYRLWVEGDQVHGLPPVSTAALRAIGEGK